MTIFSATVYCGDSLVYSKSFGNFQNAVSISTGRGEDVFVADAGSNLVFKYSKSDTEVARFGGTGFGSNGLNNPLSVDASNGLEVYVADNLNSRIQKLDYKLNVITAFDFNQYNQTADNSKKVFYPTSVASVSSGDLAVITKTSENKAFIITTFSDINTFLGSNFGFDRIGNPIKVVRGKQLDVWILDGETNELINFTYNGLFVKRLKLITTEKLLNITYSDDYLYMLTPDIIYKYDLKGSKFDHVINFSVDQLGKITDFAVLNSTTFLFLTKNKINVFNLNK